MVPPVLKLLSQALVSFEIFEEKGETSHIDQAIDLDRQALALCPPGELMRPVALSFLLYHLTLRYDLPDDMRDLEVIIVLDRETLGLHPPGHPDRSRSLSILAFHLRSRYKQLGVMEDLEEVIVLDREALGLHPPGHPDHSGSLNNLAADLQIRYKQLGIMEDLEEAFVLHREALGLRPPGHPDRSSSLNNLACVLQTRYNRLGIIEDLEEGIVLHREALGLRPPGHPDHSGSLNNLANALQTRYKRLGIMGDLEEAIVLDGEALGLCPPGHPDRSGSLNNLANHLHIRYDLLGVMEDLEEAIVLDREALGLRPPGHPDRSGSLDSLANHLHTRYQRLGVMEDLEGAIVLHREALGLRPPGHPHRSCSLNNLANGLQIRYKRFRVMEDLEEAIVLDREALGLRPLGHPDHSGSLNNLAGVLQIRYKQLRVMEDLEEAIVLHREALGLHPPGHPYRSGFLYNLANGLQTRYRRLGVMEDLEEAIVLDREALGLRLPGHPDRSSSLNNLACGLRTRHNRFGNMEDLEEAIVLNKEALGLTPPGHPDHSSSLNSLAIDLQTRYNRLGVMEDLEEAIVLHREALGLCPPGHPDRSRSLDNLACDLQIRYKWLGVMQDLDELFNLYAQLSHLSPVGSPEDISTVNNWIDAAEIFRSPTLILAYETSLRFLTEHLTILPSLPTHHVLRRELVSSIPFDAFSACLRNNLPRHAIELLEQGRGVFWSQRSRLHSPLLAVIESCSEGQALAEELAQLAQRIQNALHPCSTNNTDSHEQLWRLNLKLRQVVTNIRAMPGLSRFLLPPLFSDIRSAACEEPVIILNASRYSCDALILFFDRDPVHIPLQITRKSVRDLSTELHSLTERAKREEVSKQLAYFLRTIWDRIVGPIATMLQKTVPRGSRIWWCPTAEFSSLPLHAAGPFRRNERNLSQIYISSYTLTLTSLIRARQSHALRVAPHAARKGFLAIGQATATGENMLQYVGAEVNNLTQLVEGHATITPLEGEASSIARVSEALAKCEWVHFACHGLPDRKHPFQSAFALHDGHFTIERMIGCQLHNPEFAYLSACHTTVGDEESPDEAIHLAGAMQFLGFKSVIGTMWAVDDMHANTIASMFYRHMVDEYGRLDYTRAAVALNRTLRTVKVPLDQQILYIHIGV